MLHLLHGHHRCRLGIGLATLASEMTGGRGWDTLATFGLEENGLLGLLELHKDDKGCPLRITHTLTLQHLSRSLLNSLSIYYLGTWTLRVIERLNAPL